MRLPTNADCRIVTLGLAAVALSGCALPGKGEPQTAGMAEAPLPTSGPAADYPIVLGEPFTVDGELYTPEDVMNYDEVGYAALDNSGGQGITVSHRTLPLPSYIEITSLDSGKTVLVRVERRGPMSGTRLVALSPGAQAQLRVGEGGAVRVRRVNPPEVERAELRSGGSVPPRLETPQSLVTVLRDRLPEHGSASLRSAEAPPVLNVPGTDDAPRAISVAASTAAVSATGNPISVASAGNTFDQAFRSRARTGTWPQSNAQYPLAPLESDAANRVLPPVIPSTTATPPSRTSTDRDTPVASAGASNIPAHNPSHPAQADGAASRTGSVDRDSGRYQIQAAAFTNQANARRAAQAIDGSIVRAGRFFRVQAGPYTTLQQAEAALAKVRAAGYRDARVFTTG